MSPKPFHMMMMSGVLRHGTVERRFDQGQARHHSADELPGFLTSFWGLPRDAIQKPSVELHRLQSRTPDLRSTVSAGVWQFSLKKSLARLFAPFNGVGDTRNRGPEQHYASKQSERICALESSLNAERERICKLSRELMSARATLKRLSEVQAELDVERETGRQLVQFLEAAERESAELRTLNK